ncbi:MAG: RNA polymerase sigma factor [Phycisphaerae bacterium]|nr:RNA polymerase sigma factor [Phycisphaerae bacterium]
MNKSNPLNDRRLTVGDTRDVLDKTYRLCLALLGRAELAEEATQEVFLRMHERPATWQSDAPMGAWLRGVAINVCRELRRKRWRQVLLLRMFRRRSTAAVVQDVALQNAQREAEEIVRNLVSDLPASQREVIVLRFFEDLSTEETAATLKLPVGTVKSRLHRGLERLRERLAREPM